jgi:hypothetical protein
MLSYVDKEGFAIRTADIPHCPKCGSPLIPSIRNIDAFVEKPYMVNHKKLLDLLADYTGKKLLLFELGVGRMNATVIRYPFELTLMQRPNTKLVRINLDNTVLSLANGSPNAIIIQADLVKALHAIAEQY